MSRKTFDAGHDTGAVSDVLAARFATSEPTEQSHAAAPAAEPARMTTRSWYLPRATAEALTAAADRLRHTIPALSKAEALDALLHYALEHETDVSQSLRESRRASQSSEELSP